MLNILKSIFGLTDNPSPEPAIQFSDNWQRLLASNVAFYRALNPEDKTLFEKRVLLFLDTTKIIGRDIDIVDKDRLLIAASAIIPVWSFRNWHYFNLTTVILLPYSFNYDYECKQFDALFTGMVGSGALAGKMILSRDALYLGFANNRDKKNVGIHEFAHLIDMADGDLDGFPERLTEYAYSIPWFKLIHEKTDAIVDRKSNIRDYAATNQIEFFAVATEYFFERPKMLRTKHPALYQQLQEFYRQNTAEIAMDIKIRKKAPCPCGSGKRYKHCCMPL